MSWRQHTDAAAKACTSSVSTNTKVNACTTGSSSAAPLGGAGTVTRLTSTPPTGAGARAPAGSCSTAFSSPARSAGEGRSQTGPSVALRAPPSTSGWWLVREGPRSQQRGIQRAMRRNACFRGIDIGVDSSRDAKRPPPGRFEWGPPLRGLGGYPSPSLVISRCRSPAVPARAGAPR